MKNETEAPAYHEAGAAAEILTLFPNLPWHALESFLIICSAYPIKSMKDCLPDLRKLAEKSGGNAGKAVQIYNDEFEADMRACAGAEIE